MIIREVGFWSIFAKVEWSVKKSDGRKIENKCIRIIFYVILEFFVTIRGYINY